MNETARIFVAGHRGLVGSAIQRCLLDRGFENIVTRTHGDLDLTDQRAIREFNVYLSKYPDHPKEPLALLKKGYAFIFVDQTTQGVATLKRLVQDFPKSREASLARERLGKLGGKP